MSRARAAALVFAGAAAGVAIALLAARRQAAPPEPPVSADRVEDFRLLDQKGVSRRLYDLASEKAIVLFIYGNGCPIVQKSAAELAALKARYGPRGVAFLGLDAQTQDGPETVARQAAAYGFDLPILMDESQMISRSLGVTRTAEVLVIEPKAWRVAYRGAVDDRLSYGAEKASAAEHHLTRALDALLDGRRPPVQRTAALGCLIRFEVPAHPTYVKDAAPVLKAKCQICHASESDPAPLMGYTSVRGWAPMIRETIRTGLMPLNAADPHVGRYANNPALSPGEARALIAWTESGLERGEGPDPLEIPPDPWRGSRPDIVYKATVSALPDDPRYPYRIVVLDPKTTRDLRVKRLVVDKRGLVKNLLHDEVLISRPGVPLDPRIMALAELAARTRGLDYSAYLFTLAGLGGDVAQFIPKDSKILLKIHYPFPSGTPPGTVELSVGLVLDHAPGPGRLLRPFPIWSQTLKIPPGAAEHREEASAKLDADIDVFCLGFHMHRRGRSVRVDARYRDGRGETLLSVPNVDFHTRQRYCLDRPKRLPAGTTVTMRAVYDNSARNRNNSDPSRWVRFGFGETEEMMETWLFYADAAR